MAFMDFVGSLANQGGTVAHGLMQGKLVAADEQRKKQAADADMQRYLLQQTAQQEEARHNAASEEIAAGRQQGVDPVANHAAWQSIPASAFPGGHKPDYVPGDDWTKVRARYLTGELGQQNQTQMRIEFPPQGNASLDSFTAMQAHNIARDRALAAARQLVHNTYGRRGLHGQDFRSLAQQYNNAATVDELAQAATEEFYKMEDR